MGRQKARSWLGDRQNDVKGVRLLKERKPGLTNLFMSVPFFAFAGAERSNDPETSSG
ncbi:MULTISPECIES: hypothetical protein [unclassified Mesotoga]|uniref:hypothetical protein n=1 Tax=unclassified Mesotoga TaxID=1184398 RepID=UPI0015E8D132|nr:MULTISPECIES: hypothetical protein [unclassified Mesotoga]